MLKRYIITVMLISPSYGEDVSLINGNNHSNHATLAAYININYTTTFTYRTITTSISKRRVLIDNNTNTSHHSQEAKHVVNADYGITHERNMQAAFGDSNENRNGLLDFLSLTLINENDSRRLQIVKPKLSIHENQSTIETINTPVLSLPTSSSSSSLSSMTKQKQNRNNSQKGIESPNEATFETPIAIFEQIPTLSSSTGKVPMTYGKDKKKEMETMDNEHVSAISPSLIPFHVVRLNHMVNDDSPSPNSFQIR